MRGSVRATVLIPSHEHGPLLLLAARSTLAQTVEDIEVFIVLDGADDATREAAHTARREDDRVHVIDRPKGARHGEAYRHEALAGARGEIVCYLADDDLWFPDHVEYLLDLLEENDFANVLPLVVMPDGRLDVPYLGDLADPRYRQAILDDFNFVPLGAAGHTMSAYRSLSDGWTPAPPGLPTDLHMWKKFAAIEGLRMVSGGHPTLLHLPSVMRPDVGIEDRLAELRLWSARMSDESERAAMRREGEDALSRAGAHWFIEQRRFEHELWVMHQRLDSVRGSVAYRAARRLAGIPVLGTISRWVGRALAGREDR
ncbi:MAG TPA: glycosyltransferase family 2 protein [Acidimicrobiia bacterium]|nr:glycosyltransferase family 2 protein [Acidimicrobiia bacterium]